MFDLVVCIYDLQVELVENVYQARTIASSTSNLPMNANPTQSDE